MKKNWILLTAIVLLFTFPLTACSTNGTGANENTTETNEEIVETGEVPNAGGDSSLVSL